MILFFILGVALEICRGGALVRNASVTMTSGVFCHPSLSQVANYEKAARVELGPRHQRSQNREGQKTEDVPREARGGNDMTPGVGRGKPVTAHGSQD
jgi:hypothetical protein